MKKKLKTISKLKKDLDQIFSIFIRKRDEKEGCITCGKKLPWRELHAGHFFSRSYTALRWDKYNVHGQCPQCNIFLHGNHVQYFLRLEKLFGRPMLDSMMDRKTKVKKLNRAWLEQEIVHYKSILRRSNESLPF